MANQVTFSEKERIFVFYLLSRKDIIYQINRR